MSINSAKNIFSSNRPEDQGSASGLDRFAADTGALTRDQLIAERNDLRQRVVDLSMQLQMMGEQQRCEPESVAIDREQAEARLRRVAFYDPLTGLPNRALFLEKLTRRVSSDGSAALPASANLMALLCLDLDRFEVIKYSVGHPVSEQLLVAIAHRLKTCLPTSAIIARFEAGEFTLLLDGLTEAGEAIATAKKVQQALSEPFAINGHELFTTASIGIALNSMEFKQPEDFLRAADTAMHQAKVSGKGRYVVFDTAMQTKALRRLQLDADLRHALDRQEFYLQYQPIVSLTTQQVLGVEALVRWKRSDQCVVSPTEFIPLAEETGFIVPLGNWVLRQACHQVQQWQQQFPRKPSLFMSVNLSVIQLGQSDLLAQIDQILQATNLDARYLKLEITETAVMENAEWMTEVLKALKARSLQLTIDDFGTGYSSLSYLPVFPFDQLKVDRSFVSQLGNKDENTEVVRTITMLAHCLGMKVTAEGIETPEQLAQLRALQCEYGQGYLFSHPLDKAAIEQLLMQELSL